MTTVELLRAAANLISEIGTIDYTDTDHHPCEICGPRLEIVAGLRRLADIHEARELDA